MTTTPEPENVENELRQLRAELAACPDDRLPELHARAVALAARVGSAPSATAPALAALYPAFDAGLRVGDVAPVDGASADLCRLAERFAGHWVVADTQREIEREIAAYTDTVRKALRGRDTATAAVAEAEGYLAALTGLLAALDAIAPPVATSGR